MNNLDLKQKLESEKEKIIEKLALLQTEDPLLTQDRESSYSFDDDTAESESHDRIVATVDEARDYLDEIEEALARFENGTYGTCENCGKEIDPERLAVYPAARLCITCQK